MAAAGDAIPVNFTVENRGGADPGNFQVQVLLANSNVFDSSSHVLATLHASAVGSRSDGPDFSSRAGFSVTVPAGYPAGTGDHRLADRRGSGGARGRGIYDKSGVHRGSDWEPLTVVTRARDRRQRFVRRSMRVEYGNDRYTAASGQVSRFPFTVSGRMGSGEFKAEVEPTSGTLLPRLTLSGVERPGSDSVG